jgi:hypothetical protein
MIIKENRSSGFEGGVAGGLSKTEVSQGTHLYHFGFGNNFAAN